jgi:hypothetical protein
MDQPGSPVSGVEIEQQYAGTQSKCHCVYWQHSNDLHHCLQLAACFPVLPARIPGMFGRSFLQLNDNPLRVQQPAVTGRIEKASSDTVDSLITCAHQ